MKEVQAPPPPPPPWWATANLPASNGWGSPSPPPPPPAAAAGPSSYDYDDLSIFHPSRHEGLHPQTCHPSKPPPSPHREPGLIHGENRRCEEEWLHRWRRRVVLHARCLIGSGVDFVNSKLQSYRGGGSGCINGGVVCSVAAAVGMFGFFVYMRRRHRREKAALFLLLLQEKDQKITLLLQQIAWMKEIIAARHGVSVPGT